MKNQFAILNYVLIAFITITSISCSSKKSYEKQNNGIIISLGEKSGLKKIRLQALSRDIIRVTATPTDSFSTDTSLVVLAQSNKYSDWKVEEDTDKITLSTPNISAQVTVSTGAITFKDSTGKILLDEKKGGGKTFTAQKSNLYSIRQVFESPSDEAFYGLGQHQHGVMNYKGKDVELAQHNMDVAIPFIYSNKNYGILWDNYSVTRFGDPKAYEHISSLNLFSKDDQPGGLTATYYVEDKVLKTQQENKIDFEFLETEGFKSLPKEVSDKGKIIWEGSFSSDKAGKHKFILYASNYFKLWIDGKLIMDKWRQNWNPWSNPFFVDMDKDSKHTIKIEWIPQGGFMALKHLDPMSEADQNNLSLFSEEGKNIDYYFIRGNNADEVISGYREITGKATIVPKWAMGFWQSRERYKTQEELLDAVKTFRKKRIPIDNIVLDWFYWPEDKWGSHKFDTTRFPDAKGMVDELHNNLHANIMISVWPKFYPGTENFNEMQSKGYLYQHNLDKKRVDWVGPGYANTFYDPFNKGARDLFWKQINNRLGKQGFDAWWLDASEPDMHSNLTLEERILNMSPTAMGPGAQYFNAFPLMNAKGVYESQRQSYPDKRVFILTRSAFAGQQRFGAATWSGDIVSRWSDLKDQISAGVNFSLSGIPYWTMDIGGFALENRYMNPNAKDLDEWRELNTRWYQFGAFCPLFRVHGQFPFREVFNIAPENHPAYQSMLYYDKLRYSLMPYLYTLAGKTYHDNYTIMRGLVMDFGTDTSVLNINDQFMLGPSLLINPVYEYKARERQVYLPSTTNWYDLNSGTYYEGGKSINAKSPLTTIPVYVKEGSILPMGPEIQYVNEKPDSTITLYVYAGKNGQFELYEDEGNNYHYEKGVFSKIPISYNEKSGTLTFAKRQGSFKGMLNQRTFRIISVTKDVPVGFGSEAKNIQTVQYNGAPLNVQIRK